MKKVTMEEMSNILTGLPEVIKLDNEEQEQQFRETMQFATMCVGFASAVMTEWADSDSDEERTPESVKAFIDMMCSITAIMAIGYECIDVDNFFNFVQD